MHITADICMCFFDFELRLSESRQVPCAKHVQGTHAMTLIRVHSVTLIRNLYIFSSQGRRHGAPPAGEKKESAKKIRNLPKKIRNLPGIKAVNFEFAFKRLKEIWVGTVPCYWS